MFTLTKHGIPFSPGSGKFRSGSAFGSDPEPIKNIYVHLFHVTEQSNTLSSTVNPFLFALENNS